MNEASGSGRDLVDIARLFDPARLAQARRISKMSKADLHRKVGVSAAAIGQYERGEVRPRAETVAALARALHVPPEFFALGRPRVQVDIAEASFRRLRSTTVTQQQQATAYVEQTWELSCYLEESVEFPELNLPAWALADSDDVPDPVTAARAIRQHWNLGAGPIQHLVYQLEQHGILTVFFSMKEDSTLDEKSRIDAFSTVVLPRPIIVLTPDKANDVMRHRFSAAHELGHVVLHHGRQGTDSQLERQADMFAAEFLTPREIIRDQLPNRLNFKKYEELGQRWGVSVQSLIYRSRELELISESTARRAYITLSSLPRRTMPVEDYEGERPELLKSAIELLAGVGVSLSQIATDLQMTPRHIRRLADIDDPQPKLSLVQSHPNGK
ncbi:XRE family transcriptional regulator [Alpinimonas psychrophila]|uniref:Zn-dependent peptidase ImmA (M78 family)/transcriptional regulator with XRE-family HTH domain n=1 Tax=Alpinimonas psychrophila TaxID=748908 RepID=A0A7W3JSE1_9MICO|nr:Zn-dependent peptidase ImmA (M78 family)/transcriptional regulator with XRE-family HTH domain [Alpinimonas psychrophila]